MVRIRRFHRRGPGSIPGQGSNRFTATHEPLKDSPSDVCYKIVFPFWSNCIMPKFTGPNDLIVCYKIVFPFWSNCIMPKFTGPNDLIVSL